MVWGRSSRRGSGGAPGSKWSLQGGAGICQVDWGVANRQGGSCCGRTPETAGQGVGGNHREYAEMVAMARHREWGQGGGQWEFPALFSSAGWGWGVGTLWGWSQGGVAASCLRGLVSLCGALLLSLGHPVSSLRLTGA